MTAIEINTKNKSVPYLTHKNDWGNMCSYYIV